MGKRLNIETVFKFTILVLFCYNVQNAASQQVEGSDIGSKKTMESMVLVNKYIMDKYPDPGIDMADKSQPGNSCNRSIYFEGLMSLYKMKPDSSYLLYALTWAQIHKWGLPNGVKTRNAEDQVCGQTYIDLYLLDRYREERIKDIRTCIDNMIASEKINNWTQIDQLQMTMPVFARLGAIYHDKKYFDSMNKMYMSTRGMQGKELYSNADHLWFRDTVSMPPFMEPNGENCYNLTGNGLLISALVRTLDFLPKNSTYSKGYETTLREMFDALVPLQRTDGFWNSSLKDSTIRGGKEPIGTSLVIYGMAWGINEGLISKKFFLPVVTKAWNALITESVHPDGFHANINAGTSLSDNPEDFRAGCFLLAGSEVYKLGKSLEPKEKEPKPVKKKEVVKATVPQKNHRHSK